VLAFDSRAAAFNIVVARYHNACEYRRIPSGNSVV
jgi:hypothetical protein